MVREVGILNVVLLFADTLVESPGLYEFNRRASDLLGIPITRISREMTPWQLFRREKLIGNNRFPICSTMLKREPLNEWMASNFELDTQQGNFLLEPGTVVLGFDWTEDHRVAGFKNEHPTWRVRAPMTEGPLWDKCTMEHEAAKLGLPISNSYVQGFPHDNCNRRCVRAGISQWVHLYHVDRPAFTEWEDEEILARDEFLVQGVEPMSMLKDRRGGETRPLYLRDLRLRIESGEKFPEGEWGGCGCGGGTKAA